VPCALILNELITNSLLHAYPERSSGCITISFRLLENGENELVYHDDGIGLDGREELGSSPGARSRNPGSLGMQLIHVLSQQLEGSEELRSEGGLHFRLTFPETTPAPSSAEAAD
jgi:two-component sensor histidine kinase